jgi:hypothetical protein
MARTRPNSPIEAWLMLETKRDMGFTSAVFNANKASQSFVIHSHVEGIDFPFTVLNLFAKVLRTTTGILLDGLGPDCIGYCFLLALNK